MTKEMQELIDRELNAALERLNAARQRLLKTKTDEANGVVSNVTVNLTAGR